MRRYSTIRSSFLRSSVALLVILLLVGSGSIPAQSAVVRPFAVRFSTNTTGAITLTGNTLLTCPAAASGCLSARQGTASTLAANNDNSYSMVFVDIDNDATTFNSSRNSLAIPSSATVAFAGLYWGADTTAGTGGSAAPDQNARNQVRLKTPLNGGYQTVTASRVDTSPVSGGVRYQGFADVTDLVVAGRSGEYTVANLQAGRGNDRYGGWALVVAYQDPSEPLRNLTIFDGYAVVQRTPVSDQNVAINVSGFLTPQTGPVRSRVGVVAYEGDLGLLGDSLRLNTTPLSNSLNPATNFFNSSLTGFGSTNTTGDPFQANMLGFDVDTVEANGILANSASSATINLNTTDDTYFPGVVSFSTELFSPQLDARKSGVDVNGGSLDQGDEVLYTITVKNTGGDSATSAVLNDLIPDGTSYLPGSLRLNRLPMTDVPGDDAAEFATDRIVARLGNMAPEAEAEVSFRVTLGALDPDEVVANTATLRYTGATSGLAIDGLSNTVVLSPRNRSDLSILKSGQSEPVTVPDSMSFRITVTNRGPAPDPAVEVVDDLPAGFSVTAVRPSKGVCGVSSTTIACDLAGMDVGEVVTIDVDGSVAAGSGRITNTASVSGANLDRNQGNNTANATVRLNNRPTAVDHLANTPAVTAVTVAVLAGSSDPDGDTVFTTHSGQPTNGSAVVNPDGTVTYTPNSSFKGDDTFDYTVADGRGGYASGSVTVSVGNAPPIAANDAVGTLPGNPVVIAVLDNDTDPNGDALSIVGVTQPPPSTGTVTINGDGTVTFSPAGPFSGTATFNYTVSDGSANATATVTVEVPGTAPVAVDDTASTASGMAVDIAVLANDLDDNGDTLSVASLTQPAGGPATGLAILNADGTITFTPAREFRGDAVFTYEVTDGGATDSATVTVSVANAAPSAVDDAETTPPGTEIAVDVLANDSDLNGDALTIIGVEAPSGGFALVDAGGTITYRPNPGFRGVDAFTYAITDGFDSASATVRITVPNSPPVAAADRATTASGSMVSIPVLINDSDPNSDPLSIESLSTPANGSVTIGADGSVEYTPTAGFRGLDVFTYSVTDGIDSAEATVTVRVLNAPPIAVDDEVTTPAAAAVQINVLDNDTDLNGDQLSVLTVSAAENGVVLLGDDGVVSYTPSEGFTGVEVLTYVISDGSETSLASIRITVADPATLPTDPLVDPPISTPANPAPSDPAPAVTPPANQPVTTLPFTGATSGLIFGSGIRVILGGLGLLWWAASARRSQTAG